MTPEQMEKRKRIMSRSIALGHCVCDPNKPCPCPVFKNRNVCECAGERLPVMSGEVRLTETVRGAGCASKIGKKDLHEALAGLPEIDDPRVLVGSSAGDDAGVIVLGDGGASILTVDVFAPSVDDPYTFGQIAAANSVSDIYAMGGKPEAALSIIGFPIHTLPPSAMREILRGGIDKMKEAGVPVVGGHSINDSEVKCGFAVLGSSPVDRFVRNQGARPGDDIVLTKPLGNGIVAFAAQIGRADKNSLAEIAESMASLNKTAGEQMVLRNAHAATDVTGFSLLGHMSEIIKNSKVEAEIDFDALPLFSGVKELSQREILPGAVERNRESVAASLLDLTALAPAQENVLFGPETSGGLLVFLPKDAAPDYVKTLQKAGVKHCAIIGRVTKENPQGLIRITSRKVEDWQKIKPEPKTTPAKNAPTETPASCCCGVENETPAENIAPSPVKATQAFQQYMATVNAPGALDAKTKKLIALALSVVTRCGECVKINTQAAQSLGATTEEISEAVALGISFGGAPVNMFYNGLKRD
jgi:selenide,water dikinase